MSLIDIGALFLQTLSVPCRKSSPYLIQLIFPGPLRETWQILKPEDVLLSILISLLKRTTCFVPMFH